MVRWVYQQKEEEMNEWLTTILKSWFWIVLTAAISNAILSLHENNTTIGITCLIGTSTALGIKITELHKKHLNHD